ncbi:MAG: type II secretion system F family protein [Acidimicrobiales bacterium]
MSRLLVASGLLLWLGVTLAFSQLRLFSRPSITERLLPYAPGGMARPSRSGVFSVASFREAIAPVSHLIGSHLARVVGITEDLDLRLSRIHATYDSTSFRVRQVGYSVLGFGVAALATLAIRPPSLIGLTFLITGPILTLLVQEQRLASASARWQRRVFLELPVMAEQLALLLSAGWSLSSALSRLSRRSSGACAADLVRVCNRISQGLSETEALREWAKIAKVDALDRLVPVLALNRDTSDLGRLIAEEARSIRRDMQRELIEIAERRDQQVWIPVTVATLIPGVLFMAIPFIEALRMFGA